MTAVGFWRRLVIGRRRARLYRVTEAINSSVCPVLAGPARAVADFAGSARGDADGAPVVSPRVRHPTRAIAEQVFNIERWTETPRGGHLAALEAPDLLASDVAAFFRSLRQR